MNSLYKNSTIKSRHIARICYGGPGGQSLITRRFIQFFNKTNRIFSHIKNLMHLTMNF